MVKALKFVVVAGAALALVYLFAPRGSTRSGNVKPSGDRKALSLDLPRLEGGEWSLAGERGSVVLVNFWATWCAPCRMETPGLVSIAKRYGSKGLRVVGVTMDDNPKSDVPGFVSRFRIPYPILLPTGSQLASEIESLPTSLLIDRDGRVARTYFGAVDEETLSHDIDQLLAERS